MHVSLPIRLRAILASLGVAVALAGRAQAGLIVNVDPQKANANGSLVVDSDLSITTGTAQQVTTSFTFNGKTYMGRTVTQANGPTIVVYDLLTFQIQARTTLSVSGADPIGFLTLGQPKTPFDVLIEGTLSASADGRTPGAGGGSGGRSGQDGGDAAGARTGGGKTGMGTGGGAGGGGGFGGNGGRGAVGGTGMGNRSGGDGGKAYGDPMLSVLFGGGGGAGSQVAVGDRSADGGGGGGGILINARGKIKISGRVEADGFRGSDANPGPGLGGGGGAGGGVILSAMNGACVVGSIVLTGQVSARGGGGGADNVLASGGGGGGGGRVFLTDPSVDLKRIIVRNGSGGTFGADPKLQGVDGAPGAKTVCPEPSTLLASLSGALVLSAWTGARRWACAVHRAGP